MIVVGVDGSDVVAGAVTVFTSALEVAVVVVDAFVMLM